MATIEVKLNCEHCGSELHPFHESANGKIVYKCPVCRRLYLVVIEIFLTGEREVAS